MPKIAYFDCFSGISGDMFIGALLDAGLDFSRLKAELAKLNLPDDDVELSRVTRGTLTASKFEVVNEHKKACRHLSDMNKLVERSDLPPAIKQSSKAVFRRLAEAEAKIHGKAVDSVHFHEIGVVDTIIDVVGALAGLELLGVQQVCCSPLNLGSGFVNTAHGKLPVPAPATAELVKGIRVYSGEAREELVTPTGAAIITEIATSFGAMPDMTIERVGYGAGSRDMAHANVLRIFIGQKASSYDTDIVTVIETNIDDMNPQFYDSVLDNLMQQGALDVYLTNIQMKKNRPAVKLTVLCEADAEHAVVRTLFTETTSIGMRIRQERRKKLQRQSVEIETELGKVRFKLASLDGEVVTATPEFEDCKKLARQNKLPLKQIHAKLAPVSAGLLGAAHEQLS